MYKADLRQAASQETTRPVPATILILLILAMATPGVASQAFQKGSELYLFNKPAEAAVYLQQATVEDPANYQAWLYLGICQTQLKRYTDAKKTFTTALDKGLGSQGELYFNLGCTLVLAQDSAGARQAFSRSSAQWPGQSRPDLNLGNLEVREGNYPQAIASYQTFLQKSPDDPLAPDVVKMISRLQTAMEEIAAARLAEEQRLAALKAEAEEAERQRLAAAEAARQAEQKRKELLDSIFSDLDDLVQTGDTMSAGGADVQDTVDSLERED